MPNEPSTTLPRKKPSVLWLLGVVFVILILLFCYQLFGPNPPIIVSTGTTYITEPLGPDGMPDYERHLLNRYREGITPENNAAVLIWQALWPGELQPPQYAAVAQELGLDQIPLQEDALEPVYKFNRNRVRAWLKQQGVEIDEEQAEELIYDVMAKPWTSVQLPPLADWVRNNQEPLDMLVEASHRPRCYFPSPSLLDNERESLIVALLPGIQGPREAGRALSVRAMWRLGEGRHAEAWQDLLAIHRLGRLVAQGQTIIEELVGVAIDGIATEGTLSLLNDDKLTAEQARQIQQDLSALPNFDGMAESIDQMERLWALDSVVLHRETGIGALNEFSGDQNPDLLTTALNTVAIDWNTTLRELNRWYDRMGAAARITDWQARAIALDKIDRDRVQMEMQIKQPAALAGSVFSRGQRSQIVAAAVLNLFLPAFDAAMNAQDRANAKLDLIRLAAAVAVYRAEHGAYPATLADLAPNIVDKLPVDLFHASRSFTSELRMATSSTAPAKTASTIWGATNG